jgi:hypothetical protein
MAAEHRDPEEQQSGDDRRQTEGDPDAERVTGGTQPAGADTDAAETARSSVHR